MSPLSPSQNRRLFHRTPSLGARALLFALLSVSLMVLDWQYHQLDRLRSTLSTVVYPLQALVDLPGALLDWTDESLSTREQLLRENRALHASNLKMAARVQRLEALEEENRRLRALMDSAARVENETRIAEILRVDLDPFRHLILINKGTRDGVYEGQPVLDAFGVVGQVIEAGLYGSRVMLISDPNHALPVAVNRNGLRTIAVGTGKLQRLSLPFLPNAADVVPGDLLVTSGLGGRFPPGYPVARVTEVNRNPGNSFAEISAEPLAALDRVREVLLVFTPEPGADQASGSADAAAGQSPEVAQ